MTGLTFEVLLLVYEKYCGKGTPISKPIYLWYLFVYYKIYPIARAFRLIHGGRFKDYRYFLRKIYTWQVRSLMIESLSIELIAIFR